MKTILINEKEIDIPSSWNNITFEKFNRFSKLISSQSNEEELNEKYAELDEDVRSLQVSLDNVKLNTKLACFWSGLPEEEISMCNIDEVEEILSSMDFLNESYVPIAIDKFKFKGIDYFLPQAGLAKENFGKFIEAEQVEINNKRLEKGDLSALPKQMAILCKRKGEENGLINDDVIDKRVKAFQKMDMATIWDVAFFFDSARKLIDESFPNLSSSGGDSKAVRAAEHTISGYGWLNSLYDLAKTGIFTLPQHNPVNSVLLTDLYEVLTYLSWKNACTQYEKMYNDLNKK